jgi:hypothetical protein
MKQSIGAAINGPPSAHAGFEHGKILWLSLQGPIWSGDPHFMRREAARQHNNAVRRTALSGQVNGRIPTLVSPGRIVKMRVGQHDRQVRRQLKQSLVGDASHGPHRLIEGVRPKIGEGEGDVIDTMIIENTAPSVSATIRPLVNLPTPGRPFR